MYINVYIEAVIDI